MRIIVHAGMHKTGSSSIQEALAQIRDPNFHYLDWYSSNHCELFVYLFEDESKISNYHAINARGFEFAKRIPAIREEWQRRTIEQLNSLQDATVVFSAEDISHPAMVAAVRRMREFMVRWTDNIEVIAYVRSPLSFAQSAFQQHLKDGGLRTLDFKQLWPMYRSRFEHLDQIFGQSNVKLRSYDKIANDNIDIVDDFLSIINFTLTDRKKVRENEALGAIATALLYMQRRFGEGFVTGSPVAAEGNTTFISLLSQIGGKKLAFAPTIWNGLSIDVRSDISWIQSRLGCQLEERVSSDAVLIASEQDLIDLALANRQEAEGLLHLRLSQMPYSEGETLARTLDLVRKACY